MAPRSCAREAVAPRVSGGSLLPGPESNLREAQRISPRPSSLFFYFPFSPSSPPPPSPFFLVFFLFPRDSRRGQCVPLGATAPSACDNIVSTACARMKDSVSFSLAFNRPRGELYLSRSTMRRARDARLRDCSLIYQLHNRPEILHFPRIYLPSGARIVCHIYLPPSNRRTITSMRRGPPSPLDCSWKCAIQRQLPPSGHGIR